MLKIAIDAGHYKGTPGRLCGVHGARAPSRKQKLGRGAGGEREEMPVGAES